MKNNTIEVLCQYTKLENAAAIFGMNPQNATGHPFSIRLGRIKDSNDPFDIKSIKIRDKDLPRTVLNKAKRDMNKLLNNLLKISCFVHGEVDLIPEDSSSFKASNNINSERPPYLKPRMWALYGGKKGNNSGLCIVFKRKNIERQFRQLEEKYETREAEVQYIDLFDLYNIKDCHNENTISYSEDIEESVRQFIFTRKYDNYFAKDIDWKEEKETRLLCWDRDFSTGGSEYAYFGFDPNDVAFVVFGCKAKTKKKYKELTALFEREGIPAYCLTYDDNLPLLTRTTGPYY